MGVCVVPRKCQDSSQFNKKAEKSKLKKKKRPLSESFDGMVRGVKAFVSIPIVNKNRKKKKIGVKVWRKTEPDKIEVKTHLATVKTLPLKNQS